MDIDYDKLVFDITEKVLLRMPEVIGNLMQTHSEMNQLNKEFYKTYPEFKKDPLSVRSVIAEIERDNPTMEHKEVLKVAAPKIKKRIDLVGNTNCETVTPLNDLNLHFGNNGVL